MIASTKEGISTRLSEARERSLLLLEPLDDEQLNRVYSPILSPLAWDLGHIANFEELWLVQTIGGHEPLHGDLGRFYDAIENPRKTRGELPILRDAELRSYLEEVRERTLEVLDEVDLDDTDDPLLRDGFAYEMLIAHEHQHNETMLQLIQMVERYEPARIDPDPAAEPVDEGPEMVLVEGGEYEIGAGEAGFAYDNERPRHPVELQPFWIDRAPVTNGKLRRVRGRDWGGAADVLGARRRGRLGALGDGQIGAAGARAAGGPRLLARRRRLRPLVRQAAADRGEWEAACAGADRERANLDHLAFGTAPAGAYADGASDCGAVQMLGDVWEWTASEFRAYPGFEAFPYPEYSQVFFGEQYKVLRGGAWATRTNVIRPSFRNWDLPERRQIFAGLRCAKDASTPDP